MLLTSSNLVVRDITAMGLRALATSPRHSAQLPPRRRSLVEAGSGSSRSSSSSSRQMQKEQEQAPQQNHVMGLRSDGMNSANISQHSEQLGQQQALVYPRWNLRSAVAGDLGPSAFGIGAPDLFSSGSAAAVGVGVGVGVEVGVEVGVGVGVGVEVGVGVGVEVGVAGAARMVTTRDKSLLVQLYGSCRDRMADVLTSLRQGKSHFVLCIDPCPCPASDCEAKAPEQNMLSSHALEKKTSAKFGRKAVLQQVSTLLS